MVMQLDRSESPVAPFGDYYAGRRVLVTGHTGFKGAWLCHWLLGLGAEVTGVALPPDTEPSLFHLLGLRDRLEHRVVDLRDGGAVLEAFRSAEPQVVLHLAAQALVRRSYREPKVTWDSNVGGTVNVLEAVRAVSSVTSCVVVTTDKVYENRERAQGYVESEPLGGYDPYSASKAAVELLVSSYRRSFLAPEGHCRVATARAGNVIGGGDWAPDRIVTDFATSIAGGEPVVLRNPSAVRPWQHVLEGLAGYLHLGALLASPGGAAVAEAWNFGPSDADEPTTVLRLAQLLVQAWGSGTIEVASDVGGPHEAGLLALDVGKARERLGWWGVWDVPTAVARTARWYRAYYGGDDVRAVTDEQIEAYVADARGEKLSWVTDKKR